MLSHRESCLSNLVFILTWFISCQLVKGAKNSSLAAPCCQQAIQLMSTRWRECLQVPNSAILFLDVAEVRCRSWRFPKWKGISCQLIRLMECKISMCQFSGDWSYHFAIWIENACTFAEMSCLVCLAACTQSYVSTHATAKVIIFFRFPTTIWLIWH